MFGYMLLLQFLLWLSRFYVPVPMVDEFVDVDEWDDEGDMEYKWWLENVYKLGPL